MMAPYRRKLSEQHVNIIVWNRGIDIAGLPPSRLRKTAFALGESREWEGSPHATAQVSFWPAGDFGEGHFEFSV